MGALTILPLNHSKQFKEDIKDLSHQIETSDTAFEYLEWSKEKRQNVWVISPWRMSVSALGNIKKKKFKEDIESLTMHPDLNHNIKGLLRLKLVSAIFF